MDFVGEIVMLLKGFLLDQRAFKTMTFSSIVWYMNTYFFFKY